MEELDALFLNLPYSKELKQVGIVFDKTMAIRSVDTGGYSIRKSMFTTIPSIHISAPSCEELYQLLPKRFTNAEGRFFFMQSVDQRMEPVVWYEHETQDLMTETISGADLKECYARLLLHLVITKTLTSHYINQKQWQTQP